MMRCDAAFLPGSSLKELLSRLDRASGSDLDLQLYPVCSAAQKLEGLFILSTPSVFEELGAIPCTRVAGAAYAPIGVELDPPIDRIDLIQGYLPQPDPGELFLFVPRIGWARLTPDARGNSAGLTLPSRRHDTWDRARVGVARLPRMTSIELEPESPEKADREQDRRGAHTDDYSFGSNEVSQTPVWQLPGDPALSRELEQWLTEHAMEEAPRRKGGGPLGKMRRWREKKKREANRRQQLASLVRLIDLLDTDPDEGLRYAVPLFAGGSRGAVWADALAEHSLEFSLDRLVGDGEPGAIWSVPAPLERELERRYRGLAIRSSELGEHLRAATIYAHLLGDLRAAAHSLEHGEHWGDAARLRLDHLGDSVGASAAFEKAEEWDAAESIHVRLGEWTAAAHCAARRDDRNAQVSHAESALEAARSEGDVRSAVEILITLLDRRDEGLELLERSWMHTDDPLNALTDLLGELEDQASRERLARLLVAIPRQLPWHRGGLEPLFHRLARLAERSDPIAINLPPGPQSIGELARDTLREVSVSAWESSTDQPERFLARLRPDDAFHLEDVRILQRRRSSRAANSFVGTGRVEVGLPVDWIPHSIVRYHGGLIVMGIRNQDNSVDPAVEAHCVPWERLLRPVEHTPPPLRWSARGVEDRPLVITPPPHRQLPLIVTVSGTTPLSPQSFQWGASESNPTDDTWSRHQQIEVGLPAWLSCEPIGAAFDPDGTLWVVRESAGTLTLNAYSGRGLLLRHLPLPSPAQSLRREISQLPMFIHATRTHISIGFGTHLHQLDHLAQEWSSLALLDTLRHLTASTEPPSASPPLAGTFSQGAVLLTRESGRITQTPLAQSDSDPAIAFDGPHRLVVATRGLVSWYDTRTHRPIAETRGPWSHPVDIAIVPWQAPGGSTEPAGSPRTVALLDDHRALTLIGSE